MKIFQKYKLLWAQKEGNITSQQRINKLITTDIYKNRMPLN